MPVCCQVMRGQMTKADELVTAPVNGDGDLVHDPLTPAADRLNRVPDPHCRTEDAHEPLPGTRRCLRAMNPKRAQAAGGANVSATPELPRYGLA